MGMILLLGALAVLVISSVAFAAGHFWRCRYCGRGVNSDNCPPAAKCDKSPWGTHDWEMMR